MSRFSLETTVPRCMRLMFALFAIALLFATWLLHLPLMLWDHLDLVPIYDAWRQGRPFVSELWGIHDGSHFHVAAYLVLLVTTHLSGGQPWLDCLVSWVLLVMQAALLMRLAVRTLEPVRRSRGWQVAVILLALYPGHLANLQWGWQVAVFVSTLFGAVLPVYLLTTGSPTPVRSFFAACSAAIGVAGFSTALAMFPVAILLLSLHVELSRPRRVACMTPWVLLFGILLVAMRMGSVGTPQIVGASAVHYMLNYLGAGVLRFAEDLAAGWAIMGIATAAFAAVKARHLPASRPWLALVAFATGCAMLTALGRAEAFGADHAFVTRYVSFSSLFWLGWLGLILAAFHEHRTWSRGVQRLIAVTVALAVVNGVHLGKKAHRVHERSVAWAQHIGERRLASDPQVLQQAYGDRARIAVERLRVLQSYRFAPFTDRVAPPGTGR